MCVCYFLEFLYKVRRWSKVPKVYLDPQQSCIVGLTHFLKSLHGVLFSFSLNKFATDVAKCVCQMLTASWFHAWRMQIVMKCNNRLAFTVTAKSKLICWADVLCIYAAIYVRCLNVLQVRGTLRIVLKVLKIINNSLNFSFTKLVRNLLNCKGN